ncbi:hypothetical protein HYT74_00910 [Candidatus Daviesbacteria bacterium]|nr:hypothetical protein [Candidatus Daviesbacteria bacterium]
MLLLVLLVLPIWFVGFKITRIISNEKRFEVILPVSLFFSINLFILTLNLISYIFHPPLGIYVTYLGFILAGIILWRFKNLILGKIDMPRQSAKKLLYFSILLWAVGLFVIIGQISLSGDPYFYSLIAKSFTRGNFPMVAPWQPDVGLAYHYGPAIFMGALHLLTGSTFDLVQRSTAFLIVLMLATFLVWVFKRHTNLKSFLLYQLIPLIILITLGNWMIAIPKFPLELPQNFTGILDWIAKMPAVNIAFAVYGGSIVSLKDMVFFYHEMIAITLFIWTVWLAFTYDKNRRIFAWTVLTTSLASLSIINELFILICLPAIAIVFFWREYPFKDLLSKRVLLTIIALFFILTGLVIFQGGVPTGLLTGKKSEYPTLQFFPDKKEIFVHNAIFDNFNNVISLENTNWQTYQLQQQDSRLFLPTKEKWLPFIWFHPGILYFYIVNLIICLVLFAFKQKKKLLIFLSLLIPAIVLSLIYNLSFSLSNYSGRLIGLTYSFLGANVVIFLVWTLELLKRPLSILALFLTLWLVIPSFFPTLATFFTSGEKNNKLLSPNPSTVNETEEWIIKNLPYDARLLFLSNSSPYPEANIGVFMPIWTGGFKSYSMDYSPQYYDLIYTLNPSTIKEFRMTHILIDSQFYPKLPEIRKKELGADEYFTLLYSGGEEKLYKINGRYLDEASELPGTFKEMDDTIAKNAKVYIDMSYEGVENKGLLEGLIRAMTFAMRDRNMYFKDALPSCNNQFYTHQEIKICAKEPARDIGYDYLILSYANNPENVCSCKAEVIWKGFDDFIYIWKVLR